MYEVKTDYPLALYSNDYKFPDGAMHDNNRNPLFVPMVTAFLDYQDVKPPYSVLDIGCAGGGEVASFLDVGIEAVGLEGCDYNKLHQHFEWPKYPNNLFNCDITKPFQILQNGEPVQFDFITAWEVLEHIPAEFMAQTIRNLRAHCKGFIFTTINKDGAPNDPNDRHMVYKTGPKPFNWWKAFFIAEGFIQHNDWVDQYFPKWCWIRFDVNKDTNSWVDVWSLEQQII